MALPRETREPIEHHLTTYEMDCVSCISSDPLISRHTIKPPLKTLFGIIDIRIVGRGTTWCYKTGITRECEEEVAAAAAMKLKRERESKQCMMCVGRM
jgi:hypothetical protein